MAGEGRQRIDKWLWFARLMKTRTLAQKLALSGRVRVNREKVEATSQLVKAGDVLTIAGERGVRVLKVVSPGTRRGPAPEAQLLYEDLSAAPLPPSPMPPPPPTASPAPAARPSAIAGRWTGCAPPSATIFRRKTIDKRYPFAQLPVGDHPRLARARQTGYRKSPFSSAPDGATSRIES